jgi:GNAT superfamily N-acetyltransferase
MSNDLSLRSCSPRDRSAYRAARAVIAPWVNAPANFATCRHIAYNHAKGAREGGGRPRNEGGRVTIIGAGRYIVAEPGRAEVAFAIIDEYQGQGIGTALLRNLLLIARANGLKQLVAEIVGESSNVSTFLEMRIWREQERSGAVHAVLDLNGDNARSS